MTCPDRAELFIGLEEGSAELEAHLAGCAHCRALADEERQFSASLSRLRDPAPPADLLRGVMAAVEVAEAARIHFQRQLIGALTAAAALVAASLALFWPSLAVHSLLQLARAVSALGTAASALRHALGPQLWPLAGPIVAAQLVLLLGGALIFQRLISARARSA